MTEEEGHEVPPHTVRTPQTVKYTKEKLADGGQEALMLLLICSVSVQIAPGRFSSQLPAKATDRGGWIWSIESIKCWLANQRQNWKCHSANGVLTVLPGSYLEAFEDQPGNRKLIKSIFERILGRWVLLRLFILLNYGNLPPLRICSDVRY